MAKKNELDPTLLDDNDYASPYIDGVDSRNPEALKYFTDTANSTSSRMPSSVPITDDGLPLTQSVVGVGPAKATIGDYNNDQKIAKLPADDIADIKATSQLQSESPEQTSDELEQSQPSEDEMATEMPSQFSPDQMKLMTSSRPSNISPELRSKQSLLDEYKALVKQKQQSNQGLGILTGANKIAQAIASGSGAKIDDGSEMVNQLRKNNDLPIEGFLGQSKAIELQNEMDINDPNSDVSKFARENALAYAKRAGLSPEIVKQLGSLSAKQLEKVGFKFDKSQSESKLGLYMTTIRDANGKDRVVAVDRKTGEIVKDIGGKAISDKVLVNPETGQQEVYVQGEGVRSMARPGTTVAEKLQTTQQIPQQGESQTTQQDKQPAVQSKVDLTTPTVLNKVNPKLYAKFSKLQDEFTKDMKDNREVATAATLLSAKLKPGSNNEVDSGFLGGIQTQAAKLAGQKGVLTDQDLVKFSGAGGVAASIKRIVEGNFFGNMTENDINFFKVFSKKMKESNELDINNRSKLFVKNIHNEAKDYVPGLTEQNVSSWLNVDSVVPNSDMVKVISKDGKPGSIPRANLEKALKQGYKEVK